MLPYGKPERLIILITDELSFWFCKIKHYFLIYKIFDEIIAKFFLPSISQEIPLKPFWGYILK